MGTDTTTIKERLQAELKADIKPPPLYQVIMLNDDFTTMEFVVKVLQSIFHKNAAEAERIMLNIHYQGRGVCGVYTKDIAQTRIQRVHEWAQQEQHPLRCIMEPVPE